MRAAAIWSLAERGEVRAVVSAISFNNALTDVPAQFIPRLGLRHDGLSERPGDKAAISIVFRHFKNNLIHILSVPPSTPHRHHAHFLLQIIHKFSTQ